MHVVLIAEGTYEDRLAVTGGMVEAAFSELRVSMADEANRVRRPTLVTSDGQVGGTLVGDVVVFAGAVFELDGTVTGDLIVEFGGGAIVRGTVRGSIRNRGGHVHLLGAAGEVVDAAPGAVTVIEPNAVVRPAAGARV